jgi:hypothetical protein
MQAGTFSPSFVRDDCALTRALWLTFPIYSKAHDWFSNVLTGGLILGLWVSYAPQVINAPFSLPFRKVRNVD